MHRFARIWLMMALAALVRPAAAEEPAAAPVRTYRNTLKPIANPQPLLADFPQYVEPIVEERHFEAPRLVDDADADLAVRAWRFSYNARGIIEIPNRIQLARTALIVVHPWGIDDGQGWRTPEPAGVCDMCTPGKNSLAGGHTRTVIDPFLKQYRDRAAVVLYSLRGGQHPIHRKAYRSIRRRPSDAEQAEGRRELSAILNQFDYRGGDLPQELSLSEETTVKDYFAKFPGLSFGADFNNAGFWDLPIPVTADIEVFPDDVVAFDDDGYPALRDFLKGQGVRHILLTGYATDMCYAKTTAGYMNLSQDFNVFLVGDATLATFPANRTPRFATNAAISFAALNQLVTQISWVRPLDQAEAAP